MRQINLIFLLCVFLIATTSQNFLKIQDIQNKSFPRLVRCDKKKLAYKYILCPKMYQPVCAVLNADPEMIKNVNGNQLQNKQYSNGCWACADENVYGWMTGKCQQERLIHKCEDFERSMQSCPQSEETVCGFSKEKQEAIDYSGVCEACTQNDVEYTITGSCKDLLIKQQNNVQNQKEEKQNQ